MRAPVCLLLALAALSARAASVPVPDTNFEKKLADVAQQVLNKEGEPQNVSSEQDLIDQSNVVKDFDNKLKQVAVDAIPVKVVVEDVNPALKSTEKKEFDKSHDDASDDNIKRAEIDLKHPGEPQRQEHDNQNPEPSDNELDAATKIKQMIKNTQVAFNEGFKDITNGINAWLRDHEPEVAIKQSIDNLQETFMGQINKLNDTIQSYWKPEEYKDSEKPVSIKNVESGLKVLEDSFEFGVGNLTDGVRVLAALKTEIRDDPTTTSKPGSNPIFPFFQSFFNGMNENFGNLTAQVQNFFTNQGNNSASAISGTQSDDPATPRPTVWQGIQSSIQGILNRPGQSQQQGVQSDEQAPSGPFAQVIQNNPFVQSVINFIQPKPPQQAASPPSSPPATQTVSDTQSTASEGSNAVPVEKPADDQQQKQKPELAPQPAQAQPGPIQQIIQRNPIVKGIQGAVQKIQHNIMNPEKPREEAVENEKGGLYYGGHGGGGYGGGGHRPANEHNNDVNSSGIVKDADVGKKEIAEEPEKKKEEKEVQKESEVPVKQD